MADILNHPTGDNGIRYRIHRPAPPPPSYTARKPIARRHSEVDDIRSRDSVYYDAIDSAGGK